MTSLNEKIGAILRDRRVQLGITQEALAVRMGVTFQQVQKYEKGRSMMSPERLASAAKALDMQVGELFDDAPALGFVSASDREALEMVKAYRAIQSYEVRKTISDLCRTVGVV
jgi:transcriptional regulator with XRE-family HTH domain